MISMDLLILTDSRIGLLACRAIVSPVQAQSITSCTELPSRISSVRLHVAFTRYSNRSSHSPPMHYARSSIRLVFSTYRLEDTVSHLHPLFHHFFPATVASYQELTTSSVPGKGCLRHHCLRRSLRTLE